VFFRARVSLMMTSAPQPPDQSAVIAGATGAIGRELVRTLVSDARFSRVVALSRRSIPQSDWADVFPGLDVAIARSKLTVAAVDWEAACTATRTGTAPEGTPAAADTALHVSAFQGHTHAANCMGTTKKDAGSAEAFVRVDHDYACAFMKLVAEHSSPASGVRYAQVSSTGADPKSWFLYMKTKGQTDLILRPGLLQRNDKARWNEKCFGWFTSAMPVATVAETIAGHWAQPPPPPAASGPAMTVLGNSDINKVSQAYNSRL
jgi:oxidoreductase